MEYSLCLKDGSRFVFSGCCNINYRNGLLLFTSLHNISHFIPISDVVSFAPVGMYIL